MHERDSLLDGVDVLRLGAPLPQRGHAMSPIAGHLDETKVFAGRCPVGWYCADST